MHPRDIKLGMLIRTEYGLATVMKFFAPAYIGCVIVSASGRMGVAQGDWIYLRGLDLERSEPVA